MLSKYLTRRIHYFFFSSTGTLFGVQQKTKHIPDLLLVLNRQCWFTYCEKCENNKCEIRRRKSKKDQQYNDQMKTDNWSKLCQVKFIENTSPHASIKLTYSKTSYHTIAAITTQSLFYTMSVYQFKTNTILTIHLNQTGLTPPHFCVCPKPGPRF